MKARIEYWKSSPGGFKAMLGLEAHLSHCSIDKKLLHMLKLRVSQINGCAYCIDMHWKDSRAAGETEQRLYGLDAWEESPYYTDRERAALAWVESLTKITEGHVPDELYAKTREAFSEQELVDLTYAAATINAWNRIAIAMRSEAGNYKPPTHNAQ
ncbi:MAG: carboxymuconolactone decarboxylase family protein [Phycisphaerales bacterium]